MKLKPFLLITALAALLSAQDEAPTAEKKPLSETQQLAAARAAIRGLTAQVARLIAELQKTEADKKVEEAQAAWRDESLRILLEAGWPKGCTLDLELKPVCEAAK